MSIFLFSARQGSLSYLPPAGQNAERPRPFQPPSSTSRPYRPSFEPSSISPYPSAGSSFPTTSNVSPFPTSNAPYSPSGSSGYPDYSQSGYPTGSTPQPPFISPEPSFEGGSTNQRPGSTSRPSYVTDSSTQRPYRPTTQQSQTPNYDNGYTSGTPQTPFRPSSPGYQSTYQPIPTNPPSGFPSSPSPSYQPSTTTGGYRPSPTTIRPQTSPSDDDDNHPPHIHAIDVECAKDMMTINIEFNKVYNGLIYSKGYHTDPNCHYVKANSNRAKYSFTLSLNSCGTEFVNGFETQGQSYLENVLVLQNEEGYQEVWDSIRSVRCLWEGNLNKQLSIALSVGMLNQEVVTFSGDTAMASLDIQMGKGPFAPPANGLVKIGETMTLVVSITGDPGFDIQVRDCKARDSTSTNVIALTDENGCILKPKIFGAFQKTRNTGNTGASLLAYAFFNAFKFPDVMDLTLECNVELCKVNCEMCPDPNQKIEPGKRRRRDTFFGGNETLADPIKIGKGLRVIFPEELSFNEPIGICLSQSGFLWGAAFVLIVMVISSISAGCMWLKLQRHAHCKNHM